MTAYDQRYWLDNTPAGDLYKTRNIPTVRPLEDVERDVELANEVHKATFRRDLTEAERAQVRIGAEARTMPAFAGEVTLEDAHRMGWGFSIEHKAAGRDHGIAVQVRPGEWEGDPAIAHRAKVAEEVRAARIRDWQEMGRPGYIPGVASAT